MTQIVLVRHAQSHANLAEAWQGRGNADLTEEGVRQAQSLAERLSGHRFDVVASSPLERARQTAERLGSPVEIEDDLIEIDLGAWEGVPFGEVVERDGPVLKTIMGGADEPFGLTGERLSQVAVRAMSAIEKVADRIGPDGRALLVTHGGVVDAVFSTLLPAMGRRPHRMVSNASLTHLVRTPSGWRLSRFNDTAHLRRLPEAAAAHLEAGNAVLALIRHGRTKANLEGRWQGQSCWGLDEVGVRQAGQLADWYGTLDRVYASPLDRSAATAKAVAAGDVEYVEGLMEIRMGCWEGLLTTEVMEGWPDLYRRIYTDGEDLARGEDGETWKEVTDRIVATIRGLAATGGEVTGVVTHGGVIRAYIATLGGDHSATRTGLYTPANTSVSHVAVTEDGPILCDYAVAPHLDDVGALR